MGKLIFKISMVESENSLSMEKVIIEITMVSFADLLHGKTHYQDFHGGI